ncbi:MAG: glycosyltransferase family 10 domain-containing protein [Pseudomonadota bacterium]
MKDPTPTSPGKIRVKVMTTIPAAVLRRQLPGAAPEWGRCSFSLDPQARDYDWLVVYDDLPAKHGEARKFRQELLACPPAHTLLTTSEPSSIKHFGDAYVRQFGCVLTSQEAWALPHPDRIFSQAGLHWFYGLGAQHTVSFDALVAHPPLTKTHDLSMVFSPKRMRHTLHHRRFNFMRKLMQLLPDMHVYGRGARPLDDKAEALDVYRYHIAIENYIGPHHWTEKLSDAFLGLTLPFYAGCTNASDYFPAESFIPIDIRDPAGAARIIRQAIADGEYEKRLPAIIEARRRVLYEHNFFAIVSREIEKRHRPDLPMQAQVVIHSRHALRRKNLLHGLHNVYGKARALAVHFARGG